MATCLITGGAGFVGANVVVELLRRGHRAVIFDSSPDRSTLTEVIGEQAADLPVIVGDISQLSAVIDVIQSHGVTHAVHLAAVLTAVCNANPPLAMRVNVGGMVNMLEAARLTNLKRLVWASSASIYGNEYSADLIRDDTPHRPYSVYGTTKSFSETIAEHYHKAFHVDSIGIRFGFMSGPGMRRGVNTDLVTALMDNPAVGKPTVVPWSDDTVNWLFVADAARAVALGVEADTTPSRHFNIMGDYRPIREAAAYVRRLLPHAEMTMQPGTFGFAHPADDSSIRTQLGYQPEWSMERQIEFRINTVRRRHGLPEVSVPGS